MKECIKITERDYVRLNSLVHDALKQKGIDKHNLNLLLDKLNKAKRVPTFEIPHDRIVMNSVVELYDPENSQSMTIKLVFPQEANFRQGNISIMSLLGSALIGCREDSKITYDVPAGKKEILIRKIIYHPEYGPKNKNEFILLFN